LRVYAALPVHEVETSVAVTVKLELPSAVGVPEMVPPVRLNPAGSEPDVTAYV
jgi:hypothetical protein